MPGAWICGKCGFVLQKNVLHTQDGSITANVADHCEGCPNDGSAMRPFTWREANEGLFKRAADLMEQLRNLNDQIGYLPEGTHPDERNPRGQTWLQERANWTAEVEQLRRHSAELERQNAALRVTEEHVASGLRAAEEELTELRQQNAAMRHACSEMLNEIRAYQGESECEEGSIVKDWCDLLKAALQPEAGRDFIPREQMQPLVEALKTNRLVLAAHLPNFRTNAVWQQTNSALTHARTLGFE